MNSVIGGIAVYKIGGESFGTDQFDFTFCYATKTVVELSGQTSYTLTIIMLWLYVLRKDVQNDDHSL